jgi:uncharacterized membrane protein YeaQ/YmgE (transglycosylase-associated protein family)
MFHLLGALIVGGATGYGAERFGFVRNGYIVSVALGLGGAVGLWFLQGFFGVGLGLGRAATSIVGAIALLFLASMKRG